MFEAKPQDLNRKNLIYVSTEFMPKRIYTLWLQGSDNAPDIVRINFDQWERLNPDYKLIVLDEKTAAPYLKDFSH